MEETDTKETRIAPLSPLAAKAVSVDGAHGKQTGKLMLLIPFFCICTFTILAFFHITAPDTGQSADTIPNPLQNKPAPHLRMELLNPTNAEQFFDSNALKGRVTLVNFWGSWCPPCRAEHGFLQTLAHNPDFRLVGINYKDSRENALRFLGAFGNPFAVTGFDKSGRSAMDWGVYGPPETFVLDKNGIILYRFVGPMTAESFQKTLLPLIKRANTQ